MIGKGTTPQVRTIAIVVHPVAQPSTHGTPYFDVHDGERYVTELTWDELLGTIARLTHPDLARRPNYHMALPEEHLARLERRRANWRTR